MKNKLGLVIVLLFLTIFSSCTSNGHVILIDEGKSNLQIVISNEASKNEKKAANVFQSYFKLTTGVLLPILPESKNDPKKSAVFIGLSKVNERNNDIRNDGFLIKTSKKDVFIYGNSGKGTLYGVYTFIEKFLKARKLAGNTPAIVVSSKSIEIPEGLKLLQNPSFVFRQSYYPSSMDPEYLDWHQLQNFEDLWGLWGHSFFKIIDPKLYFEKKPEYFALVNGKRQATQLCLSNKDVLKKTIDYFTNAIKNNPDASYWSIGQMDNSAYCTCDECSKIDREEGGPQGSLIRFVNAVAKKFPNQNFTTLAYTYSSKPPKKTSLEANVYIMLSTIDAYRTKPLADEPSAKKFREDLKDWREKTKNIFVWDYTTQFTNYLTPFPDYNHIKSNLDYFLKNDVKGIFLHGSEENPSDMDELNSYLQAKLLWNPYENENDLKSEFIKNFYGDAAQYIESYLTLLEKQVQKTKSQLDIYGNPILDRKGYLSPENIDRYAALMDQAEAAVDTEPLFYKRVRKVALSLEYVVLQQAQSYGVEKYGYFIYDADTEQYKVNPKWKIRVQRFIQSCIDLGVQQLGEIGPDLEAYQNTWAVIFDKGWVDNIARQATLSLEHGYSPEYSANGISTLVDGIYGTKDFSYNWLLFYGNNLELTVDFGKENEVHQIAASFLWDPAHYIFLPTSIQILASDDGLNYKEIHTATILSKSSDKSIQMQNIVIPLHYFARYFKVVAYSPKKLPVDFPHPLKKPSIASDEILFQ